MAAKYACVMGHASHDVSPDLRDNGDHLEAQGLQMVPGEP